MALFDKALGVHPFAMQLRIDRAEVIASNLANVDTPNFKARDVDYQQILGDVAASMEHNNDVGFAGITANELMYRVPYQASSDGNTVELNVEPAVIHFVAGQDDSGKTGIAYEMDVAFLADAAHRSTFVDLRPEQSLISAAMRACVGGVHPRLESILKAVP